MNVEKFKDNGLHKTKAYLDGSSFAELGHQGWAFMLSRHPKLVSEFLKHSQWGDLDGSDWGKILSKHPEMAKYCEWSKLKFPDWKNLFTYTYQFAEKCPWNDLEMVETDELLRLHPTLSSHAGLDNPYAIYILNNEPDKDNDVNPSMSEELFIPIHVVMAFVLQRFFDYSSAEAKIKTREIYSGHKTLIAIHAEDFAKLRWGMLCKCLHNGGLPLTCTFEPYSSENKLKLEMRG